MEILRANNVSKSYCKKIIFNALNNITFSVNDGQFVGIMGPSGSGETTLLNMISTVDKPASGTIKINGDVPLSFKGDKLTLFRRQELGFVFQDFNLLDTLTVGENILLPLTLEGVSVKVQDEKLKEISGLLKIETLLEKRITTIMVTHDPFATSYCNRILFIKDGLICNEIYIGENKSQFYQEVIDTLSLLGGKN